MTSSFSSPEQTVRLPKASTLVRITGARSGNIDAILSTVSL
jgi:hypothetical protein